MLQRSIPVLCALLLATTASADPTAKAGTVRREAVAGFGYPGDMQQFGAWMDDLLEGEKSADSGQGPVRALISPHAAYRYSGTVAADGYRLLRGQAFKRVLLLGPAHHKWFRGLSIADVTHYVTPLGRIPLDKTAIERLKASSLVTSDARAHRREHSLEMQLPLLQRALQPGWQLVPVLVGQMDPEDYLAAAELLRPLLGDDTLVVVSSDFTHYGPRFSYRPFPNDDVTAARLKALDTGSLDFILDKDPRGFLDYKARTGTTICGYQPITLLLYLLPADSQGSLVAYATSGNLTGNYENSVSYMSIVFREPENDATTGTRTGSRAFSAEDMRLLHRLASAAVETAIKPQDEAASQRLEQLLQDIPPELKESAAAFVTLMNHGQVRGCIGSIRPVNPIYKVAVMGGLRAARDRRFAPLLSEELEELDVEISVLSYPESIGSWRDFVLGEEGVILEKDGHSAVFLPEVPEKYHWNREQMLSQLAQKAGLAADAWKEGARFRTFRTRKFSAPYQE
jgi:AmmeMemoRadiSam system protein B/AmmeMemoRadiSam system protein A